MAHRLSAGGRIDRSRPLTIQFNGSQFSGFTGDTVASILLAHGVHHVARSFKYHRPRGIMTHGTDEPSALLTVDRGAGRIDPNNRATVIEAIDGLSTTSQNHWPSLGFDLGAVSDLLSPFLAAGFYYKTFMWPPSFWTRVYEPMIRNAAGLGKAPETPDADRYASRHAHCDLLVVGAGPAGLAAALAASADSATSVILVDEQPEMGGALLHDLTSDIDGVKASEWVASTLATLKTRANVVLLPRTTAFGYYNHNHIALAQRVSDHLANPSPDLPRERLWQVRAKRVVLATGSHERPLVFADNDRPGIMLAESVRAFINRWAVAPGRAIVFATSGASAYRAALDAKSAGLVVVIVDQRPEAAIGPELAAARSSGIEVLAGHSAVGSTGRKRVTGLVVALLGHEGVAGQHRTISCDCVGMSGGWTPAVHLFSQSRGKLRFEGELDAFVPGQSAQAESSVGAATGCYELAGCLEKGFSAGAAAGKERVRQVYTATMTPSAFQPVRAASTAKGKAFIDFQNDVTAKDIRLAVREGFESIEHVKRYTTTGMATDQGKLSNMNALGVIAGALDKPMGAAGTTTFRPPYTPVSFGALIGPARGALFDPIRTTPIHEWALEKGALFENVGLWRRAWYFPKQAESMKDAVARECRAVREKVGIFDATTLGKIEVVGRDAAEFLNRLYTNAWLKLEPGRCRYGLMLKEDGYVMDDGVVARLAPDRFHVTTTTGGAARVLAHMEDYLQTEWTDLEVFLTSATEQWAVIAVQGPRARDVIVPLVGGIDLDPKAFPHMSVRVGTICGVPCRLFRVSFTGELGFEINVPAGYGRAVWEAIHARGAEYGITPYGTETMHVLRAEKGFIMVGQETDGTVSPDDLGLSGMISKAKPDFVGKRSLARPDLTAKGRKQLVGLLTENPSVVLHEGAQIVADPRQPIPMRMLGHVTSSYDSVHVGRSIAMALVADGRALHDQVLHVTTPDGFTQARVCEPSFFDQKGARVHG
ncbi:MAG: sarcosine oxidase, alpha subunit family [Reyranella sp.]|nr:sarcosine oxidase, alpha subunit family [Reyranella sp.]